MNQAVKVIQFEEIQQKVRRIQGQLSRGAQDVAGHLMSDPEDFALFTAAQIASKLGVSEATVVRFATAIGYDGYPEFRQDLQQHIKQQLNPVQKLQDFSDGSKREGPISRSLGSDLDDLIKTSEALSETQITQAVDLISSARKVYVLGFRSSFGLAFTLYHHLNQILPTISLVGHGVEGLDQLPHLGKNDVLIAISFPRYSAHAVEYAQIAAGRGVKIIALTDSMLSPLARLAQAILLARSSSRAFANANIGALAIVNAIVAGVAMKNKTQSLKSLAALESVLDAAGAVYPSVPAGKRR